MARKINFIVRLQHWMDSVPGQTFLNYAYSWGAAIVILGALFKLTHIEGGNIMLFIGMGTEVVVFFLSAFDRPFDKNEIGKELPAEIETDEEIAEQLDREEGIYGYEDDEDDEQEVLEGEDNDGDESEDDVESAEEATPVQGPAIAATVNVGQPVQGGTVIIGGGVIPQGGGVVPQNVGTASQNIGAAGTPAVASVVSASTPSEPLVAPAAESQAQERATAAISANTPVGGQPFEAEAQQLAQIIRVANDELLHRAQAVLSPEMEAATQTYIDKLNTLAETFAKVDEQSAKLAKDSEEMENLNRTLTGINKVYELHLKSISLQVGTIDQINEQTHKLAQQIEELNAVYGRMIEALTVNMRGGASVGNTSAEK